MSADFNAPVSELMSVPQIQVHQLRQLLVAVPGPELDAGPEESLREPLLPAAVLVPLIDRPSGLTVLLTKRTAHLHDHAGQVSFPGGRHEPTDGDMVTTALREAEEEVGLRRDQVEVIATLPEFRTGTGFRVVPVVGVVSPPLNLKLDDFEVADTFEVPLAHLLGNCWRRESLERGGRLRQFWATDWDGFYIWGATAGMLVNLKRILTHAPGAAP